MRHGLLFSLLLFTAAHAVSDEHTRESLRVMHGKEFSISLSSLAPAGYTWLVASSGIDSAYVTLISDLYQTKPNALIGAAGVQIFTFKAHKPGTTTITLQYKRPWEKEVVKTHTIELTILKRKKPLK